MARRRKQGETGGKAIAMRFAGPAGATAGRAEDAAPQGRHKDTGKAVPTASARAPLPGRGRP